MMKYLTRDFVFCGALLLLVCMLESCKGFSLSSTKTIDAMNLAAQLHSDKISAAGTIVINQDSLSDILLDVIADPVGSACIEHLLLIEWPREQNETNLELGSVTYTPTNHSELKAQCATGADIAFPQVDAEKVNYVQYPLVESNSKDIIETVYLPVTYYQVMRILTDYKELLSLSSKVNEGECDLNSKDNVNYLNYSKQVESILALTYEDLVIQHDYKVEVYKYLTTSESSERVNKFFKNWEIILNRVNECRKNLSADLGLIYSLKI